MIARSTIAVLSLAPALLGSCGGGGGEHVDAGSPEAGSQPIVLTVSAPRYTMVVAGMSARGGYHYLVLDVMLEAREVGPLPVAPNAFELVLADGTRANAQAMATDAIENGCTSRSVPMGSSATCSVVFEVAHTAAPPDTLVWSDGRRTVMADVPPAG